MASILQTQPNGCRNESINSIFKSNGRTLLTFFWSQTLQCFVKRFDYYFVYTHIYQIHDRHHCDCLQIRAAAADDEPPPPPLLLLLLLLPYCSCTAVVRTAVCCVALSILLPNKKHRCFVVLGKKCCVTWTEHFSCYFSRDY